MKALVLRHKRWLILPTIALLLATFAMVHSLNTPQQAHAASLEPILTNSYYLDDALYALNGGDLYTTYSALGQADADAQNAALQQQHISCSKGEYGIYTILDFGQPFATQVDGYGNNTPNPSYYSVNSYAEAYADGWYNDSYNCFTLHVVTGVNNNVCTQWGTYPNNDPCVVQAADALGTNVLAENQYLQGDGESWQIDCSAGLDIETDPGFGTYSTSLNYVNAYTSTQNASVNSGGPAFQLYDFGDASHSGWNDWYSDPTTQIYNLAWAIGYDYPFPEAYSAGQNSQNSEWAEISNYSSDDHPAAGQIHYRVALMDGSQGLSTDRYEWQDFENQNGPWTESGVFAGSIQEPMGETP